MTLTFKYEFANDQETMLEVREHVETRTLVRILTVLYLISGAPSGVIKIIGPHRSLSTKKVKSFLEPAFNCPVSKTHNHPT